MKQTPPSSNQGKRVLDVVLALGGLLVVSPLLAVVALLILAEGGGPVIYAQTRFGRGLRLFRIYKFRTMGVDAESKTGPVWASGRDPRTTRVGQLLRRWHLDELPQLINVLRGEMSLVGPRPERPEIACRLAERVPGYFARNRGLPGLTGLAQLRGGYDTSLRSVRRKIRYDRLYLDRAGLGLDVALLLATPLSIARSPGWAGSGFDRATGRRRGLRSARHALPAARARTRVRRGGLWRRPSPWLVPREIDAGVSG